MQSSTFSEILRPLTVGQILDRSIRVYRNNFATFTGIIALMLVPVTLVQFVGTVIQFPVLQAMNSADTSSEASAVAFNAGILSLGLSLLYLVLNLALVQGLARPALVRAIADSYLGEKVGAFEAYGRIVSSWPRLLVAMLVMSLLVVVFLIFTVIPCVGWVMGPGLLMFFSVIIWQFVGPIIVLEKRDAMAALRRAWDLTRRRFWWVLGFMLILSLFTYLLIIGPSAAVTFLTNSVILDVVPSDDPNMVYAAQSAIQTLTQLLFGLITMPLQTTAIVLMYFDLRVRTEGLDLAILSAEGEAPTSPEGMIAEAPPPEQGNLVTGTEALYFVGISLISVTLCFGVYVIFFAMVAAMMSTLGL
jgi:hypothetical protein